MLCVAGEFAEAVRDQFLSERIEYYKDLETAIANAAAADGEEMCTKEHVKSGLLLLDPDMATHAVTALGSPLPSPPKSPLTDPTHACWLCSSPRRLPTLHPFLPLHQALLRLCIFLSVSTGVTHGGFMHLATQVLSCKVFACCNSIHLSVSATLGCCTLPEVMHLACCHAC